MQNLQGTYAGIQLAAPLWHLYLRSISEQRPYLFSKGSTDMASFETTLTPNNAGRIRSAFSILAATVADWNQKRMTRKALEQLSDRELDDIGMSRADIARLR
jgi:uncharacterized protein YjiS (DUF1127 family)